MIRFCACTCALTLAALAGATPAEAGQGRWRPRSIDAVQHHQARRIQVEARQGDLTRAEEHRLRAEQTAIRAEERFYRWTGAGLNAWERRDLRRDQRAAGRQISRQSRDWQRR